jgi:fructose-specific phosphotransferase system component IIB
MKKSLIYLSLIMLILIGSCTSTFKHNMEVAKGLTADLEARSVSVAVESNVNTGQKRKLMTRLSFEGTNPTGWDASGVAMVSNLVAYKFMKALSTAELKDETHVCIDVAFENGAKLTNEFTMEELREADDFIPTAEKVMDACIKNDHPAILSFSDPIHMSDSLLSPVYPVLHYNDSIYAGQKRESTMRAIYYTDSVIEGMKVFSVTYLEKHDKFMTRYDMNFDRATKKLVSLEINTNPI